MPTSVQRLSPPILTVVRKNPTRIGSRARLGAGAILIAPVTVGDDAVVGANAVVTRNQNVPDGQTVVGVPAQPMSENLA